MIKEERTKMFGVSHVSSLDFHAVCEENYCEV